MRRVTARSRGVCSVSGTPVVGSPLRSRGCRGRSRIPRPLGPPQRACRGRQLGPLPWEMRVGRRGLTTWEKRVELVRSKPHLSLRGRHAGDGKGRAEPSPEPAAPPAAWGAGVQKEGRLGRPTREPGSLRVYRKARAGAVTGLRGGSPPAAWTGPCLDPSQTEEEVDAWEVGPPTGSCCCRRVSAWPRVLAVVTWLEKGCPGHVLVAGGLARRQRPWRGLDEPGMAASRQVSL